MPGILTTNKPIPMQSPRRQAFRVPPNVLLHRLLGKLAELLPLTLVLCAAVGFSTDYLNAYSDLKYPCVALGGLLLLPSLWRLARGPKVFSLPNSLLFALGSIALIVASTVNLPYVINRFESLRGILFLCGAVGLGFSSAFLVRDPHRFASRLLWLVALIVGFSSAYAFAQRLGYDVVRLDVLEELRHRYPGKYLSSFFGSGPFAAQFLVQGLFWVAGGILLFRGKRRWLLVLCFAMGCAYLFLSQSRAAYLAFIPAMLLFSFWALWRHVGRRLRRISIVLPAACALVLLIAVAGYYGGIRQRLWLKPGSVQSQSTLYRFYIWRDTLRMIQDFPRYGVGYWNYDIVIPHYASVELLKQQSQTYANERINRAHNDYLDITAELGIVGAAAFAMVLATLAVASVRQLRREDPMGAACACALVATATNALFDFPLYNPASASLFWLGAGLLIALDRRAAAKSAAFQPACEQPFSSRWLAPLALLGLVAPFALLPWYRTLVSQSCNRLGDTLTKHRSFQAAVRVLDASRAIAPKNRDTYVLLSAALRHSSQFRRAEEAARAWLEFEPLFSLPHNALGSALGSQGRQKEALSEFEKALELAPTNASAAVNAATIHYLQGENEAAYELYHKGWAIDPVFARSSIRNYADAAYETHHDAEALALLQEQVAKHPDDAEMKDKLSKLTRRMGKK